MTYLTQGDDALWGAVIAALEGEGFAYDPLTATLPAYLATALGEPDAHKTKSVSKMLEELANIYDGPLSNLTTIVVALLDDLATNISAGGGEPYVASAVRFNGSTRLVNTALTAVDNGRISFSFWAYVEVNRGIDWVVDPEGDYRTWMQTNLFAQVALDLQTAEEYQITSGGDGGAGGGLPSAQWCHVAGSADTNFAGDSKLAQLRLNGVDNLNDADNSAGAFAALFNGLPFWVGSDGDIPVTGGRADMWIAIGQYLDFSNPAVMAKFRDGDGKPVFLGEDGLLPTGVAPTVFFSGDSTGYATNRGTGGAFSVVGTLANAATSPSD